jgi:uncharacterized protein (TIGR02466 family)
MNTVPLSVIDIYEFNISSDLIPKILEEVRSMKTVNNPINQIKRSSDKEHNYSYYNKQLFLEVEEAFNTVKKIHYIDEVSLKITECWATVTGKFRKHHYHKHPNSIMSAVLYLTNHTSATTNFYIKNPWCWTEDFLSIGKNDQLTKVTKIVPESGKLVIFPSNMYHDTSTHNSNDVRYTLSFNTFISGSFGAPSTYLDISPKTVQEVNYGNN